MSKFKIEARSRPTRDVIDGQEVNYNQEYLYLMMEDTDRWGRPMWTNVLEMTGQDFIELTEELNKASGIACIRRGPQERE